MPGMWDAVDRAGVEEDLVKVALQREHSLVHHRDIRACLLQMMGISAWSEKLITNLILSLPGRTALKSLISP